MQNMQKILCWSNWKAFNSATSRTHKRHKGQQSSLRIRDAYSQQPARIRQPRTYFTTTTIMSKRRTDELLGIFIYTVIVTTTFIDRRTENQRLKPPVLSGEHVTPHHTTQFQNSSVDTRHAQP